MKVCCVFSLELPHRGNSHEYTTYHYQYKKENHPLVIPNTIMSEPMGFFC